MESTGDVGAGETGKLEPEGDPVRLDGEGIIVRAFDSFQNEAGLYPVDIHSRCVEAIMAGGDDVFALIKVLGRRPDFLQKLLAGFYLFVDLILREIGLGRIAGKDVFIISAGNGGRAGCRAVRCAAHTGFPLVGCRGFARRLAAAGKGNSQTSR